MLKFPVNEQDVIGTIVISSEYYREEIYEGYYNILMGVLNSVENGRVLCMEWGSGGPPKPKPPVLINTRSFEMSKSCLLDENGHMTGQQTIHYKKQKKGGKNPDGTDIWVDVLEEWDEINPNFTECPPYHEPVAPYRAGQYIGPVLNVAGIIDFNPFPVGMTDLETYSVPGLNFLFLSIPTGKTFRIVDGTGTNMRSDFGNAPVATDNKVGFQNNSVWQMKPSFGSSIIAPYTLTINL